MSHGLDNVEGVEGFSLLLYSGDKLALQQATELGWPGVASAMGLPLMKEVLERSASAYSIFFVSQALRNIVDSQMSTETLIELHYFLIWVITQRHNTLNPLSVDALIRLLCAVLKKGFIFSHELQQFPINVAISLLDENKACMEEHVAFSCSVLINLIDEIENANNSTLVGHKRVHLWFRNDCLLPVFRAGSRCIKELPFTHKKAIDGAARLVRKVLMFDFNSSWTEASEDVMTKEFPQDWSTDLVDQALQLRLWELYASHTRDSNLLVVILEVLTLLVSLNRSLYRSPNERIEWLSAILANTFSVMESRLHLEDAGALREFCRLLNRIKPNFSMNDMLQIQCYPRWIRSLAEFSKLCFQNWRHARQAFLSLTSIWAKLVGAQSYCRDGNTFFDVLAPDVCAAYVASNIEQAVRFVTDEETAFYEDYLLDTDAESLSLEMQFASELLRFCGSKVENSLLEEVCSSSHLLKGSLLSFPMQLSCLCERLAWVITLVSRWLKLHRSSGVSWNLEASMIVACLDVVRQSCDFSPGNFLHPSTYRHLHRALLSFLRTLWHVLFVNRGDALGNLLDAIMGSLSVCESKSVRSFILICVAKEVMHCVHFSTFDMSIAVEALDMLSEMIRSPSTVATLKTLPQFNDRLLVDIAPRSTAVGASTGTPYRVQYRFSRIVTEVHFSASGSDCMWSEFLKVSLDDLERRLERGVSEMVEYGNVICSWRGVFLACLGFNEYRALLKRLSPRLPLLVQYLRGPMGSDSVVQTLRLIHEISENRRCRINFGTNGVEGYQLFRYISQALSVAIEVVVESLNSSTIQLHAWALKCLRILFQTGRNILGSNYCNLGVFRLYGDESLSTCMRTLWQGIMLLNRNILSQYEKLSHAFLVLAKEILTDWYGWFLSSVPVVEVVHVITLLEFSFEYYIDNLPLASLTVETLGSFAYMLCQYGSPNSSCLESLKTSLILSDHQILTRLLRLTLDIILSQRCSSSAVEWLLRPLILLESHTFRQIAVEFTEFAARVGKDEAACAAFEVLCTTASDSILKNDRDLFAKEFKKFYKTITGCLC